MSNTPGNELSDCWDDIARRDRTIVRVLRERMFGHAEGGPLEDIWVRVFSDKGVVVGESEASYSRSGSGVVIMTDPIPNMGVESFRVTNYDIVLKDPNWLTLHTGWLKKEDVVNPGDTIYLNAIYFDLCEW